MLNGMEILPAIIRPTKDAETIVNSDGRSFCSFRFACNRSYPKRDKDGNVVKDEKGDTVFGEQTFFARATANGSLAERIAQVAKKGVALLVEGYLITSEWTPKDENGQDQVRPDGKKNVVSEPRLTITGFRLHHPAPTHSEQ